MDPSEAAAEAAPATDPVVAARSVEDSHAMAEQPTLSSPAKDQPDPQDQRGELHEQQQHETNEAEEEDESASDRQDELTPSSDSEPANHAANRAASAASKSAGLDVGQTGPGFTRLRSDNFSQTNADPPVSDDQLPHGVRRPQYQPDNQFRIDKQTQLDPNELINKLTDLKINELYDGAIAEQPAGGQLPDLISDLAKKPTDSAEEEIPSYQVKWIKFRGKQCAIIMQNVNGCCPLLAIMNVLLLRGKIQLPLSTKLVTYDQVIVFLANFILENGTNSAPEGLQLDYEQNINDAMQLFPKLQTGLDVNVQFNSVTSFEYTSEMIIFDLLGISLYHGWIVDRDDLETVTVVGSCSYNQLVDKIITNKSSNKSEEVSEALIAERFLESTASQLTYFGLSELVANVREQELSILFRNNHFITLYKNQNQLYQLVTDQGFMQEPDVVWMTLSHIDNDDTFLNSEFKPSSVAKSNTLSPTEQKKQIDADYLIALSIEEEEKKQVAVHASVQGGVMDFNGEGGMSSDEYLARKLQEVEDRREVQEYERNRAVELYNRKLDMQRREMDGRQNHNDRFQSLPHASASHASPPNRHPSNPNHSSNLNRTDSDSRADYSRHKQSNLHPNSSTPSENHTQSSSSGRGVHRNSNHGHHKKNCVIS